LGALLGDPQGGAGEAATRTIHFAPGPVDITKPHPLLILLPKPFFWLLALGIFAHPAQAAGFLLENEIYEREMIQRALNGLGLETEPTPKQKKIVRVYVVRYPVVEDSDPWPDVGNLFHVTTREHIIRQELLFNEGEIYSEKSVRESARNLRALPLLFSSVRIVTARSSTPNATIIVVITKDLWSIRLNANGNFGGGVLNFFTITPSEQNFLGYNQQLSLHYYIDRDVQAYGQIYRVPRLWGSRLALIENLVVRTNHHTHEIEGGHGSLSVQRPLFSMDTPWAFLAKIAFDIGIFRAYQGTGYRMRTYEFQGREYNLPEIYQHKKLSLLTAITRSFGRHFKTNLSLGYNLRSFRYGLTDGFDPLADPLKNSFQKTVVPLDDQAGSLQASLEFFEAHYVRLHNVNTLGLTEDFRLGPWFNAKIDWTNPAFGFSQKSCQVFSSLGYNWLIQGNLLSVSGTWAARYMPDHSLANVNADWIDRFGDFKLSNISPQLWDLGRLVLRLHYVYHQFSQTRSLERLGGENSLRGFVSGYASGPRLFNINIEFRSRPWVMNTMHLGLVLFYDGGDAFGFSKKNDFSYHHSLGLGLRTLFPQFDRVVFRVDMGIPLNAKGHTRWVDWLTISLMQAF
jgi:hypothetical protein